MIVKVCGNRFPENMKMIYNAHPDMMGFIFYNNSKRSVYGFLEPDDIKRAPKEIIRVGVFVNEKEEIITGVYEKYGLDIIQLHGSESPGMCRRLKEKNIPIIKAFNIDFSFDFESTSRYSPYCHFFLFDAKGLSPGGNGTKYNWKLLDRYTGETPFFLSGGLSYNDIPEIRKLKHNFLFGVDINSCFESAPGVKDFQMVKDFINEIR